MPVGIGVYFFLCGAYVLQGIVFNTWTNHKLFLLEFEEQIVVTVVKFEP